MDAKDKRNKIKNMLLVYSHYDKNQLVNRAKKDGLYAYNLDDDEVYNAIVRFAKFHNIKIHTEKKVHTTSKNEFIEEIDKDGNSKLKPLKSKDLIETEIFVQVLEKERDNLSKRILNINKLINLYNN